MAIITLPAKFSFTDVPKFGLQRMTNIIRSRYTGQGQRVVYPYAIWQLQGTLVEYDGPEAAAIRSFLVQLEGQKNSFRIPVPGVPIQTNYPQNPFSYAGIAGASSVDFYGAGIGTLFKEGDYFTVNDELKMITANVVANGVGGGSGTISFKPALRKSIVSGTQFTTQNPTCLMTAVDDDVATWSLKAPIRHGVKFAAIEMIDI
jgi:hypothetical protein